MRNYDLYAQLELIPNHRPSFADVVKKKLAGFGKSFLNFLSGSMQPRITEGRDRQGNLYFRVYDPCDHSRHTFASEMEVRVWLEQRYYQP
ncbi:MULTISPECIES: hypothetical protein [Spirulina sp. CCY15215]|uniref:hypothetical protein n=1 Tax=Spirulina sp. CCY15215 TaxID=2767591 RepID=UPI0019514089|nr:hypothetical protein [Spirulina major]